MKVKDLINELEDCNPEEEVYLASDPEGNNFRQLYGVDNEFGLVINERRVDGPWLRELTEDKEQYYSQEDVNENAENVVILWP